MKSIALPCLLIVTFSSGHAWSQGATGGSLGNDNKSLSGSSSEPRSAPAAPRERSEPRAAKSRRGSDDGGGSVARFDGRWRISFTGRTQICAGLTADSTMTFSNGRASDGSTVSSSGAFQGAANTSGVSAIMTGRLSGRSGGGAMRMSNGCAGRWTAVKL